MKRSNPCVTTFPYIDDNLQAQNAVLDAWSVDSNLGWIWWHGHVDEEWTASNMLIVVLDH